MVFLTFGPYHLARAEAFAQRTDIRSCFIELESSSSTHPWRSSTSEIDLYTLPDGLSARRRRGALCDELDRLDPDVVVTCGYNLPEMIAGARWARRHDAASVLMHETTAWDRPRLRVKEALKSVHVRRNYDSTFLGGKAHRDYIVGLGADPSRIFEPYDVVDNELFRSGAERARIAPDVWRSRLDLPEEPFFLYVGRLSPEKNLRTLLRSYRAYRQDASEPWSLAMVGDGPIADELKRESPDGVSWHGFRQVDELPAFYGLASCFVLPSLSEPWGLVTNEAMAAGLPIAISNRCGCAPELLDDGANGFAFDPTDPVEMTSTLRRVAEATPEDRDAWSRRSQEIVGAFTPEAWAEGLSRAVQSGLELRR